MKAVLTIIFMKHYAFSFCLLGLSGAQNMRLSTYVHLFSYVYSLF